MSVEILEPGVLASVQEPFGRRGWRHLGVPVGGAADGWSARLANRLVGNPDDWALLEVTLGGTVIRFGAPGLIAVTGGVAASVDGLPLEEAHARAARAGSVLRILAGPGARGYVAVAGAIEVPEVLGSRSTDLRSGFGGHEGRALRAGDRLEVGVPSGRPMRWVGRPRDESGPIRLVAGPHAGHLLAALTARRFTVGAEADRVGVRLAEAVEGGGEAASMGLPLGAVQLPPDGRPIVMLADRPVTGGYPVPAVVIEADAGRVAQLRPGDGVRFVEVSPVEARAAARRAEEELAALEPLDERGDGELGWTGSHR